MCAGNYILITWDMLSLGSGLLTAPYQLGAYSTLGDAFVRCIKPSGLMEMAENYTAMPLVRFGGRYAVHNRQTQQLEFCINPHRALLEFVEFLETMKQRVRPAYDGVVLVSYSQECTPLLLQRLEQFDYGQRFWRAVAALGDLGQYMKEVHAENPAFRSLLSSPSRPSGLERIPLEKAYSCAFQRKMPMEGMFCDLRANYTYQVMLQLHQKEPNYANFYRV
jgi:hypothetical protein